MGVPGNANALLLKQAAAAAGGYEISRSVRFSSSDSAYLVSAPPASCVQQEDVDLGGVGEKRQAGS
jgi:hypothetical protein